MQKDLPEIKIGPHTLGSPDTPLFILGPCVIESESFVRELAPKIKEIADEVGAPFVFKASYDKANRSSVESYRGIDCPTGCKILGDIGRELGVPVTTDVHTEEQAKIAGEHIDILQIPAFLSLSLIHI